MARHKPGLRSTRIGLFLFLPLIAALLCVALPLRAAERLTILHVNDFHGRVFPLTDKPTDGARPMGGAAYLAAMIEAERAGNPSGVILLSAGDMFQGTPISDVFHGRPVLDMMNALHFDGMTLGNHEFDWGRTALAGVMEGAAFPVLSANIVDGTGRYLSGVKPYVMMERKGVKIAVIGLTTPETPYATKAENVKGLTFLDPAAVLPGLLAEVRRKGAVLIVLLTHLGLDEDKRLAAAVEGVDVIVGGHSHTVVTDPVTVGKTIIVQAGFWGLYLGVLELAVDKKTGRIEAATRKGELKAVSAGPHDPFDAQIARAADGYRKKTDAIFSRVVGETRVPLTRHAGRGSVLGHVVADAMRESAHAEIAIQNSGAIRADIPAGRITLEQVYTVLPFDDVLVAMDLSGAALLGLLEESIGRAGGMLQVSGMEVRLEAAPPGTMRIKEARVGGAPLDGARMYRVVTNDFLAVGGDRVVGFKKGRNVTYGDAVRDAVIAYLKKHSPLAPGTDERTVVRGR